MALDESSTPDLLSGSVNIKWEEGARVPVAILGHTAVLFNGAVYVGGGTCDDLNDNDDYSDAVSFRVYVYHPDTNKWDSAINTPYMGFAMTVLMDKLIIVGGLAGDDGLGAGDDGSDSGDDSSGDGDSKVTNKLLLLESNDWKEYSQMPTARMSASAVSHQSMMIVMGGLKDDEYPCDTTELLDSTTGQWFKCDDLPKPYAFLQTVIIGGILYALGGATPDDDGSHAVYAAPLDALSTQQLKWQRLEDSPQGDCTAVSVNNKYLLAVGGDGKEHTVCVLRGSLTTSTSWEPIGSLPKEHRNTSAVSLANRIIVIGGTDGDMHSFVTIGTFQ